MTLLNVFLAILAMANGVFMLRFVAALATDKLITVSQLQFHLIEVPPPGAVLSCRGFGGVACSKDCELGHEKCATLPVS